MGKVAFIGFGEAGMAFASGWQAAGVMPGCAAFDIRSGADAAVMAERYAAHGVTGAVDPAGALAGADTVICVVTADQALAAARAGAAALEKGAFWLDCNSCAPGTKQQAAAVIEAAGGHYVDVAVMAPVHPKRHKVPLLLSGPRAGEALERLERFDMAGRVTAAEVGHASSIKMLRSVMIKGMEALSAECFLAARRAGVEEEVIASLEASDPDIRWRERGSYNLERMMVHGARRAAEMREVAVTVAALELPEGMASATALWQDWVAGLGRLPGEDDLVARLDRVLGRR